MQIPTRLLQWTMWLTACGALVAGLAWWWWPLSETQLAQAIARGEPARALTVLDARLVERPDDVTLNLLAAQARLALCVQRDCVTGTSGVQASLLQPVRGLLQKAKAPVVLDEGKLRLTSTSVVTAALQEFAGLSSQPQALEQLLANVPPDLAPLVRHGLWLPTLLALRAEQDAAARRQLQALGESEVLLETERLVSELLHGMLSQDVAAVERSSVMLRQAPSATLPSSAAATLPWVLRAAAKQGLTGPEAAVTPSMVAGVALQNLPVVLEQRGLEQLLDVSAAQGVADELLWIERHAQPLWQAGWPASMGPLDLNLQRLALVFQPNQPELWTRYLPALIARATQAPQETQQMLSYAMLTSGTMSVANGRQLGERLLAAAQQLHDKPALAAVLIEMAGQLPLSNAQVVTLEKMVQELLVKASATNDVTATLVLAQARPQVASNNRQIVVPVIVNKIRQDLRSGAFAAAVQAANLLTQKLELDVELGPIVLQEWNDEVRRRRLMDSLRATTAEALLQPATDVALDLGPLFTFMLDYFAAKPQVIQAQLTTLIAGAQGVYGPATAMYRLGNYMPAQLMTPSARETWVTDAVLEALLQDSALSGVDLMKLASELVVMHPGLSLAPVAEEALKRSADLPAQRVLWQQSPAQMRAVMRLVRPEYSALMQGVDALEAGQRSAALVAMAEISDPHWRQQAQPYLAPFLTQLRAMAGVYVPVSPAPGGAIGMIEVRPLGLLPGALPRDLGRVMIRMVNRVGTVMQPEADKLGKNYATLTQAAWVMPVDFDTMSLTMTPTVWQQMPDAGKVTQQFGALGLLRFQIAASPKNAITTNTVLQVGLRTASGEIAAVMEPFVRTLVDAQLPLWPDGIYLVQQRLGQPAAPSETALILPPGSLLTVRSGAVLRPRLSNEDTLASEVYEVSGTVRHPASVAALPISGFFDADTATMGLRLRYPLPVSGQPVTAVLRCQALAGPIVCGAHHEHSPRLAYVAQVQGMLTQESLQAQVKRRAQMNLAQQARSQQQQNVTSALPAPVLIPQLSTKLGQASDSAVMRVPVSETVVLQSAEERALRIMQGLISPTGVVPVSTTLVTPSVVSPSALMTPTEVTPAVRRDDEEALEESIDTTLEVPPARSPTTVVLGRDEPLASATIPAGAFVYRGSNPPVSGVVSLTTPTTR